MAQNVTIAGASYPDVPGIDVPKTGGGTARFVDTSDANATAGDIVSGKSAYVGGVKLTGTNSGSGGGVASLIIPVTLPASLLETKTATVTMESGTAAQIAAALAAEQQVYLKGVLSNTEQDDDADIVLDLTVFIPVQMMKDVDVEVGGETVESFVNLMGASFMSGYKVTFLYDETQGDNTGNAEIFHFAAVDDAGGTSDIFWVTDVLDVQTFTLSNVSHSYSQILDAYNAGKEIKVKTMYYTSPSTYEYTISDLRTYQASENRFRFITTFATNFGSGYAPYMLITVLDSNDQTNIDIFYLSGTQVT